MPGQKQYLLIYASAALLLISVLLTLKAGVSFSVAIVWNFLAALDIMYYSLPFAISKTPLIFAANLLDVFVFALLTVWLASLFFDFFRSVRIRDRIILNKIKRLHNHIVIAPFNGFSETLIEGLDKSRIPYVVIVDNEKEANLLYSKGKLPIVGDPTQIDVLRNAGAKWASHLVTCSADDVQNILISISAKSINDSLKVISRIVKQENLQRIGHAGIYKIVMPEIIAGEDIGNEIVKRVL